MLYFHRSKQRWLRRELLLYQRRYCWRECRVVHVHVLQRRVRRRELPNSERMRQRCSIHRFRRRFSVYELASERVELFTYVQQWLLPLRGEVVHSWRANGHCCV